MNAYRNESLSKCEQFVWRVACAVGGCCIHFLSGFAPQLLEMSPLRCGLPVNDGVCGGLGFDRSLEMRPLRCGIPVKAQFCVKLSVSRLDLVSLWYQYRRLVWFGLAWFSLDSSSSHICVPTHAQFWILCCCCCTRAAVGQSSW